MHFPLQAWCVLVMWIVGLLWATGLLEDACRFYHLRWLKIRAIQTIDRTLLQIEYKNVCQCAALRAAAYGSEHAIKHVTLTTTQVQELARGLAEDHIGSTHPLRLSQKKAQRCYIATFSTAYFLHTGRASIVVLPFGQKKTVILF